MKQTLRLLTLECLILQPLLAYQEFKRTARCSFFFLFIFPSFIFIPFFFHEIFFYPFSLPFYLIWLRLRKWLHKPISFSCGKNCYSATLDKTINIYTVVDETFQPPPSIYLQSSPTWQKNNSTHKRNVRGTIYINIDTDIYINIQCPSR